MSTENIFHRSADVEEVGEREYRFIASDETPDSYGDVVAADGWDLKRYRRNPIVLWQHDSRQPIGISTKFGVEDGKLVHTIRLAAEGTSEMIDTLNKLMKQKIVRAVSVGFRSLVDPEIIRDKDGAFKGLKFIKQELLELSVVSVPANPNSLSLAKSWGVRDATVNRIFGQKDAFVQRSVNARRLALLRLGASA